MLLYSVNQILSKAIMQSLHLWFWGYFHMITANVLLVETNYYLWRQAITCADKLLLVETSSKQLPPRQLFEGTFINSVDHIF